MRKLSTLVGLTVFALAGSAFAQERIYSSSRPEAAPAADPAAAPAADPAAVPATDPAAAPADVAVAPEAPVAVGGTSYVARGLTQSAGNLQVTVPIVLNLSKDLVLKPVWVPLDVRYGITDELEVFLNHFGGAPVSPLASEGGVCLGGEERGCAKPYDNLNLGLQFSFLKNPAIELAAIGALVVRSIDASTMAVALGVNFKYASGPVAVKVAPQIAIGANKRDEGNKEILFVPVQVAFQATPELAIFLDTGIAGPTDGFGDSWILPVGVGASFAVMPNLDVGAEFLLPMVATGMDPAPEAFDMRMLALFAQWRLK